jgi:hypothetical protein
MNVLLSVSIYLTKFKHLICTLIAALAMYVSTYLVCMYTYVFSVHNF